jgi:ATP-binding cassette, subfamily B, bacterial PglK
MIFSDTRDSIRRAIRMIYEDKSRFYFAVFLCILGGGVELFGVGTLSPFLALLANPKLIESSAILRYLYAALQFQSADQFLLWSGWMALFAVFFASLFFYFKNAYIIRFCVGQTARISVKLLDAYLRKPMLFHNESNSSELSKDVIEQSDQFTNGILMSIMTILGDGVIMLVLIGLVLTVDWSAGLIIILMFGLIFGATLIITSHKIQDFGRKNDDANGARFVFCIGALQSIKEIKTSGKEAFFGGLFRRHAEEMGRCYANVSIIQIMPQAIMQFAASGAVIGIALYYIAAGVELSLIMPKLVIYAVAGYRLMPSFHRLSVSLTQLQRFQPAVNNISKVFEEHNADVMNAESNGWNLPVACPKIEFCNVGFAYPKSEQAVFDDLDIMIEGSSFVCFVGASGSGKTTLVDLLLGLLSPDKGAVMINGKTMSQIGEKHWREMFGYVPQSVYIVDGTITENIAFGIPEEDVDREKLQRIVKLCHLEDFIDSQPDGLSSSVGEQGCKLSGGQRQRIGIARALYRDPPILILDESTSSLDGISEKWIIATLNELKRTKTIITIAHRNSLVRYSDRVVLINHGEIAADGDYQALCCSSPLFTALMSEMEGY